MKSSKRWLSLLLCVIMVLFVAACSSPPTNSESSASTEQTQAAGSEASAEGEDSGEKTLPPQATPAPEKRQVIGDGKGVTLKLAFSGEEFKEDALFPVLEEFFKETGISTEVIYVASDGGWGGYFSKIQTMIAANDTPDVIRLAIEGFRVFQNENLILPIDDFMAKDPQAAETIKDLHPNLLEPFRVDGKLYGLTFDWNNVVTHINTDALAKKQIEFPKEDWSLNDFREIAKKLTYTDDNGQKVFGFAIPNFYFAMAAWFYANGGSVLNDDWTKCTLDSPEVIEVMQLFHDMIYVDGSAPVPPFDANAAFISGQVAMQCAGRWTLKGYNDSNFTSYDIQYLPLMKPERKVIGGIGIFPIMAASKHQDEAFKLAVKLSSADSQKRILETTSIQTSISAMDQLLPAGPPKNSILFRKSADVAKAVEAPAQYNDIQAAFDRYLSLVLSDEMSAADAMKACAVEIDGLLAN